MSIQVVGLIPCVLTGYGISVAVETPVLFAGLQRRYSFQQKLAAGFVLTACTYPFVCFIFPILFAPNSPLSSWYIAVSEVFAPVAECAIFWMWLGRRESFKSRGTWQDLATIVVANLASFMLGELLKHLGFIDFVC